MLCQKCQQRPATVFFSQTVGNQTTQAHLCEVCAQEQGQAYGGMNPMAFNPFAAFSDFLNNFMAWDEGAISEVNSGRQKPATIDPQLQCPHCGYQLSFFRQNGRLGCTKCYESFKAALEPLISGIHGNVRHVEEAAPGEGLEGLQGGEAPRSGSERRSQRPEIVEMRRKIEEAIKTEKYEEAARLRDEIKKIEAEL
jgi:protein arginine kinase activator